MASQAQEMTAQKRKLTLETSKLAAQKLADDAKIQEYKLVFCDALDVFSAYFFPPSCDISSLFFSSLS